MKLKRNIKIAIDSPAAAGAGTQAAGGVGCRLPGQGLPLQQRIPGRHQRQARLVIPGRTP